jgi:hypothetical protein
MVMPNKTAKNLKMKKTLDDLLSEGQLMTGKALLDERVRKERQAQAFALAAQEEARMQRGRKR